MESEERKKMILLSAFQTCARIIDDDGSRPHPWLGITVEKNVYNASYGKGRGCPGMPRTKVVRQKSRDVWKAISQAKDNIRLKDAIHMDINDFLTLLDDMYDNDLPSKLSKY